MTVTTRFSSAWHTESFQRANTITAVLADKAAVLAENTLLPSATRAKRLAGEVTQHIRTGDFFAAIESLYALQDNNRGIYTETYNGTQKTATRVRDTRFAAALRDDSRTGLGTQSDSYQNYVAMGLAYIRAAENLLANQPGGLQPADKEFLKQQALLLFNTLHTAQPHKKKIAATEMQSMVHGALIPLLAERLTLTPKQIHEKLIQDRDLVNMEHPTRALYTLARQEIAAAYSDKPLVKQHGFTLGVIPNGSEGTRDAPTTPTYVDTLECDTPIPLPKWFIQKYYGQQPADLDTQDWFKSLAPDLQQTIKRYHHHIIAGHTIPTQARGFLPGFRHMWHKQGYLLGKELNAPATRFSDGAHSGSTAHDFANYSKDHGWLYHLRRIPRYIGDLLHITTADKLADARDTGLTRDSLEAQAQVLNADEQLLVISLLSPGRDKAYLEQLEAAVAPAVPAANEAQQRHLAILPQNVLRWWKKNTADASKAPLLTICKETYKEKTGANDDAFNALIDNLGLTAAEVQTALSTCTKEAHLDDSEKQHLVTLVMLAHASQHERGSRGDEFIFGNGNLRLAVLLKRLGGSLTALGKRGIAFISQCLSGKDRDGIVSEQTFIDDFVSAVSENPLPSYQGTTLHKKSGGGIFTRIYLQTRRLWTRRSTEQTAMDTQYENTYDAMRYGNTQQNTKGQGASPGMEGVKSDSSWGLTTLQNSVREVLGIALVQEEASCNKKIEKPELSRWQRLRRKKPARLVAYRDGYQQHQRYMSAPSTAYHQVALQQNILALQSHRLAQAQCRVALAQAQYDLAMSLVADPFDSARATTCKQRSEELLETALRSPQTVDLAKGQFTTSQKALSKRYDSLQNSATPAQSEDEKAAFLDTYSSKLQRMEKEQKDLTRSVPGTVANQQNSVWFYPLKNHLLLQTSPTPTFTDEQLKRCFPTACLDHAKVTAHFATYTQPSTRYTVRTQYAIRDFFSPTGNKSELAAVIPALVSDPDASTIVPLYRDTVYWLLGITLTLHTQVYQQNIEKLFNQTLNEQQKKQRFADLLTALLPAACKTLSPEQQCMANHAIACIVNFVTKETNVAFADILQNQGNNSSDNIHYQAGQIDIKYREYEAQSLIELSGKTAQMHDEISDGQAKLSREIALYKAPDQTAIEYIPSFDALLHKNHVLIDTLKANRVNSGAELKNINCFEYLQAIARELPTVAEATELASPLQRVRQYCGRHVAYDAKQDYGKLYTQFLLHMEENVVTYQKQAWFPALIHAIYHNENHALERTHDMLTDVLATTSHTSSEVESKVTQRLGLAASWSAPSAPQFQGGPIGRVLSNISGDFKPQTTTSLACVRRYNFPNDGAPTEYRMGTQAQRHNREVRVNPLFEAWLDVQKTTRDTGLGEKLRRQNEYLQELEAANPQSEENIGKAKQAIAATEYAMQQPYTHVYFNNLGLDRPGLRVPGLLHEPDLSHALHDLENRHTNIAVITLPADKGLLDLKHVAHYRHATLSKRDVFAELLAIANGTSRREIKDFYVSAAVKAALYGVGTDGAPYAENAEQNKLHELLEKSFATLGLDHTTHLTPAQQQAVWFHFCKYEFPQFVLTQLKPLSFNDSCKDGIDRGGVSSAYYNLIHSINLHLKAKGEGKEHLPTTMTQAEFERALHAAPAMVKGRGMNHQREIIWNTIDCYVSAHAHVLRDTDAAWLIAWRDNHCPSKRLTHRVEMACSEALAELNQLEKGPLTNATVYASARAVINEIRGLPQQYAVKDSHQLLTVIRDTMALVRTPSQRGVYDYEQLTAKIKAKGYFGQLVHCMGRLCQSAKTALQRGIVKLTRRSSYVPLQEELSATHSPAAGPQKTAPSLERHGLFGSTYVKLHSASAFITALSWQKHLLAAIPPQSRGVHHSDGNIDLARILSSKKCAEPHCCPVELDNLHKQHPVYQLAPNVLAQLPNYMGSHAFGRPEAPQDVQNFHEQCVAWNRQLFATLDRLITPDFLAQLKTSLRDAGYDIRKDDAALKTDVVCGIATAFPCSKNLDCFVQAFLGSTMNPIMIEYRADAARGNRVDALLRM